MAPRFELAFAGARPAVTAGRRSETGALPRSALGVAAARADDRAVRRPPRPAEARPAAARPVATAPTVVHAVRWEKIVAPLRSLDRRPAGGFAPVEMIAHQPHRAPLADAGPEPRFEPPRPRAAAAPPAEDRQARTLQLDPADMRHLTDRMIEALDRRAIAGHERMNRR
jgi:hypothetical protein